jgi:tryptophanase
MCLLKPPPTDNRRAEHIDLITYSSTSAMSDDQWAEIMLGDEAYAASRNYRHLQSSIEDIVEFEYVLPTHHDSEGRA